MSNNSTVHIALSKKMKFGMFLAPFHAVKSNPTLAFTRDLELAAWLDRLGFDEILFGEHHSGGYETIGCPELFIAAAAERTKHIKLGTGVVSTAYHHPFNIAERFATLDHLTRGRAVLGLGPGALPTDTAMYGVDYGDIRERLEQATAVIMHLLTSEEPLTVDAGWFKLKDAVLNFKPFTRPHPPVAIAALLSPSGPRVAGRFGLPLISIGATSPLGSGVLVEQWRVAEERADQFGVARPSRADWRLVGPMHLAETREEAERDVEFGLKKFADYFFRNPDTFGGAFTDGRVAGDVKSMIAVIRETGFGVIGTPDDAISLIEQLQENTGGFGSYMLMGHEWANWERTLKSHELFANYVMPHFQDGLGRQEERFHTLRTTETSGTVKAALEKARVQHEKDRRAIARS